MITRSCRLVQFRVKVLPLVVDGVVWFAPEVFVYFILGDPFKNAGRVVPLLDGGSTHPVPAPAAIQTREVGKPWNKDSKTCFVRSIQNFFGKKTWNESECAYFAGTILISKLHYWKFSQIGPKIYWLFYLVSDQQERIPKLKIDKNLPLVLLHCTFINETIKRQFRDTRALTGRLEKRQLNFALVLDNGSPVALTLLTQYLVQLLRHRDLLWFRVRLHLVTERKRRSKW